MGRIIAESKHTGKLYPVDSKAIYRVIYEVVDVLPTENIKTSVIYCVPVIGKENEYDMFLYINEVWVPTGGGDNQLYIIDVTQPNGVHPYTDFYAPSDISLGDICNIAKEMQVVVRFNGLHTDFYGRKFEKTVYWTILCSGQKQQSGAKYFITYIDPTGRIRTLDGIYERHPVVFKWDGTLEDYAESLVENKMDLAPLNPTAEQIAAMPDGQPYRVSNAREAYLFFKGTGGGKFYNDAYNSKHYLQNGKYSSQIGINQDTYTETSPIVQPLLGELLLGAANMPYLCVMSSSSSAIYCRLEQTQYKRKAVSANPNDYFYPSEKCMVDYVEAKIGDIENALSEV